MNIIDKALYFTNYFLTLFFFVIICFIAIYSFIYVPDYDTFQISDWMINYEGGFVRRGLIGQLLLLVKRIYSYNLRYVIIIIEAVSYTLFFYLLFRIFVKYRWSLLAAMFPIACCTTSMAVYRRDFMMLCLCFVVYKHFFKYLKNNSHNALLVSITAVPLRSENFKIIN